MLSVALTGTVDFNDYAPSGLQRGLCRYASRVPAVGELIEMRDHEGNSCAGVVRSFAADGAVYLARIIDATWRDGVLVWGLTGHPSLRLSGAVSVPFQSPHAQP